MIYLNAETGNKRDELINKGRKTHTHGNRGISKFCYIRVARGNCGISSQRVNTGNMKWVLVWESLKLLNILIQSMSLKLSFFFFFLHDFKRKTISWRMVAYLFIYYNLGIKKYQIFCILFYQIKIAVKVCVHKDTQNKHNILQSVKKII